MRVIMLIISLVLSFQFALCQEFVGDFKSLDPKLILSTLFDTPNVIKNKEGKLVAKWKPNFSEKVNFPVSDDNFCYTAIDTIFRFTKDKSQYALFIFATSDGMECHACAPLLSVATFVKDLNGNTGWTINAFEKKFEQHGAWGEIGSTSLVKIGKNKFALVLEGGYLAQGYMQGFISYYDIDTFAYLFGTTTNEDNGGAAESEDKTFSYEAKIKIIPTKGEYYDIQTITTGTKLTADRKKVISAAKQQLFYYDEFLGYYVEKK